MTPRCHVCNDNIGMLTDCVAIMKGQFMWNAGEGYASMILEKGTDFVAVLLEDASNPQEPPQQALIVDPEVTCELIMVHRSCLGDLASEILSDDEDDESPWESADPDEHAIRALERDTFMDEVPDDNGSNEWR